MIGILRSCVCESPLEVTLDTKRQLDRCMIRMHIVLLDACVGDSLKILPLNEKNNQSDDPSYLLDGTMCGACRPVMRIYGGAIAHVVL